jgi:hypothetical protein
VINCEKTAQSTHHQYIAKIEIRRASYPSTNLSNPISTNACHRLPKTIPTPQHLTDPHADLSLVIHTAENQMIISA